MKRILVLLVLALAAPAALADDPKPDDYNVTREFKNRVFEIHHRDPRTIAAAVKLLGSGFKGSAISMNDQLNVITVRDFPENIAAIDDAIKRLDRPAPATPDIEMKISVLIASKAAINAPAVPEDLAPVVKELQSTLRYSNYAMLTENVHRTKPGSGIQSSGVADSAALGVPVREGRPIFYNYDLRNISLGTTGERPSVTINDFEFSMRVPVDTGNGVQYQNVGFKTPVTVRDKEKVVIGTTTMGDKALIVVVTARVSS